MSETGLASANARIYGRVQGVFFRAFVARHAAALNLAGYVRNLDDGSVDVHAEGDRKRLEELISHLGVGPRPARVERVDVVWSDYTGGYSDFRVTY